MTNNVVDEDVVDFVVVAVVVVDVVDVVVPFYLVDVVVPFALVESSLITSRQCKFRLLTSFLLLMFLVLLMLVFPITDPVNLPSVWLMLISSLSAIHSIHSMLSRFVVVTVLVRCKYNL